MNACFRDVFLIAPNVKLHPVFLVDRKIASSVRNVKTIVRNLYRLLRFWIQDFFTGEGGGGGRFLWFRERNYIAPKVGENYTG